jgi:CRP-like cAMP-binding protein
VLPAFALLRWRRLRSLEAGAPVSERHFSLLRADPIFAPLPLATLERLTHDLVEVEAAEGETVITAGDRGDRFYLIESGEVEVLEDGIHRRNQAVGESFGEIALIRDEPRTATVRALTPTGLLAIDRDRFLEAVTGHVRARESADSVIDRRLGAPG